MYNTMKENPRYLIDYKSFLSAVDDIKTTAENNNATHANDVFLVAIEEFKNGCMKRKEARAIVKEYLAKQEEEEAKRISALLGSAVLEDHVIFNGKKKDHMNEILSALEAQWTKLEEMEDGDNAKSLLFYLHRNFSILTCIFEEENMKQMLMVLNKAIVEAFSRNWERIDDDCVEKICQENDVERKIFVDNAVRTLAGLARGEVEDGDGKKNVSIENTSCSALQESMCVEARVMFEKVVMDCFKQAEQQVKNKPEGN